MKKKVLKSKKARKKAKKSKALKRYWGKDPETWRFEHKPVRKDRKIFIMAWYRGELMRVELRRKYRMIIGRIMEIKTIELKSSKKWKFVALRGFKDDGIPHFVNRGG